MNPKFRQLPPAIIGAAMMTLLAQRAGLLRGGAAAGHQARVSGNGGVGAALGSAMLRCLR